MSADHAVLDYHGEACPSGPEQSRVKKRRDCSSWARHVPSDCSKDSSSSSLAQLDAVGSVRGIASESVMVPLELPSPMPCSSSGGGLGYSALRAS